MNDKKRNEDLFEIYGGNYLGYYSNVRVACRGIVVSDNRILLVHEENTDVWMIPGGGLEDGEEETNCLIREMAEETGHLVKAGECALEIDEYYQNEKFVSKYYRCDIIGQSSVKLTDREAKAGMVPKWVSVQEAFAIFGKHQQYTKEDEMRRGLYFREYSALCRIFQGK